MKKILKWFAGIILLLLIVALALPFIFKDKIVEVAKEEIDKSLNANIDFKSLDISFLRSVPNLTIIAEKMIIIGVDEFENDTLANINKLYVSTNLLKALTSNQLDIRSVKLRDAQINTKILKSGKTNWDIVKKTKKPATDTTQNNNKGEMNLSFDKIVFENVDFAYNDKKSEYLFRSNEINLSVNGDFLNKNAKLKIKGIIGKMLFEMKEKEYLKNLSVEMDADINADFEKSNYIINKSELKLNGLNLTLKGNFSIKKNKYPVDIQLDAPDIDFQALFSLLPPETVRELGKITTQGTLDALGFIKGEYYDDHYPAFNIELLSENAGMSYSGLSEAVENINIRLLIENTGGKLDKTIIDAKNIGFTLSGNPFQANLHIANPMSDPQIKGNTKGTIDFSKLKNAIPLENMKFIGVVNTDMTFNGKWSDIEKERYERFNISGNGKLSNFLIQSKDYEKDLEIRSALLKFTPRYIDLAQLDAQIGTSDIQLKGKIQNYFQYFLKDKDMKGTFNMTSNSLDLNQFMVEEETIEQKAPESTSENMDMGIIKIPDNLDLTLYSDVKSAKYKDLDLNNVTGVIHIKDSKASLSNLQIKMLDGDVKMAGNYNTTDLQNPKLSLNMDMQNVDVKEAYNSLEMLQAMMPIAASCEGKVSSTIDYNSLIDNDLNPVINTMNGKGTFSAREILIKDNKVLNLISNLLNNEEYSRLSISQLDIDYIINNGNIAVKPFETKLAGKKATISGIYGADESLNFAIQMAVPKKELGTKANEWAAEIPGLKSMEEIEVIVKIEGTSEKPNLGLDMGNIAKQVGKSAIQEITEKLFKKTGGHGDSTKNSILDKVVKDSTLQKTLQEGLFNIFKKQKKAPADTTKAE